MPKAKVVFKTGNYKHNVTKMLTRLIGSERCYNKQERPRFKSLVVEERWGKSLKPNYAVSLEAALTPGLKEH